MKRSIFFFKFACRMFSRRVLIFSTSSPSSKGSFDLAGMEEATPCGAVTGVEELGTAEERGEIRGSTLMSAGILASGFSTAKYATIDQIKYPGAAIKMIMLTNSRKRR